MKKFLFLAAIMLLNLNASAQTLKVMKDGKLIAQFWGGDGYEFVYEKGDEPEPDSDPDSKPSTGNLLSGTFSVSATKTVKFTKGNLYWDGSAYHFEGNQTDYLTEWNPCHAVRRAPVTSSSVARRILLPWMAHPASSP